MTPQSETWSEYRRLILKSLEEIKEDIDELRADHKHDVDELKKEIGELKTQATMSNTRWGIIAGIIGFLASLIPNLLGWWLSKL